MSRRQALVRAAVAACVVGFSFIGSSALGAQRTEAGLADPRIKTVDYDPLRVVRIVGVFRSATQIILGPGEVIQHVALGDTSGWEVAAETNILFVKPTATRAPTNLIVTTKDGQQSRNYTFELTARSGATRSDSPDTFFVVRFRYRSAEAAQAAAAITAQAAALETKIIQFKLDRGVLEGRRNLAYALQGSAAIAPSEVSDNGRFTVLRFAGAQPVPAIFAVGPDGAETLVSFDVRGEFVIVHQIAGVLRLRRGREVLCVINQRLSRFGQNLGTGTSASDIDRTLKPGSRP